MGSVVQSVVVGAGQAGLSAAHHLLRLGLRAWDDVVVLDANPAPGGAWQHRWDTLTMADVHGVAALPEDDAPPTSGARANAVVPEVFGDYERRYGMPVVRPVRVGRVEEDPDVPGALRVTEAPHPARPARSPDARAARSPDATLARDDGPAEPRAWTTQTWTPRTWTTRTVVNATGTWERPFVPHYPGAGSFAGRQLHTQGYRDPGEFAGQHVVVVGGGLSAVQILAEVSEVASTTWVTRREPTWRTTPFTPEEGRAAVALVEERARRGLPPESVVSVTGLMLREQERAAAERGVYERRPMFERIVPDGVVWADGRHQRADVILWATGFRPDVGHLGPLGLRSPEGGIQLEGTTAVRDRRVQLVGYGPSASTIGANRAGRVAARGVLRWLERQAA